MHSQMSAELSNLEEHMLGFLLEYVLFQQEVGTTGRMLFVTDSRMLSVIGVRMLFVTAVRMLL